MSETSASGAYWDRVYAHGDTTRTWYQPHADTSLDFIATTGRPTRSVVDVGGGASTLADDLLRAGYRDVTVVDISTVGMALAQERLRERAQRVHWLVADVRTWVSDRTWDIWHDRAVLHFLVAAADRTAYRAALLAATHPGSLVVLGAFGPNGPDTCSGLPVTRQSGAELMDFLGPGFERLAETVQSHVTPSGAVQEFCWVAARRG